MVNSIWLLDHTASKPSFVTRKRTECTIIEKVKKVNEVKYSTGYEFVVDDNNLRFSVVHNSWTNRSFHICVASPLTQ